MNAVTEACLIIVLIIVHLVTFATFVYLARKKNHDVLGWIRFAIFVPVVPLIIVCFAKTKEPDSPKETSVGQGLVNMGIVLVVVLVLLFKVYQGGRFISYRRSHPEPSQEVAGQGRPTGVETRGDDIETEELENPRYEQLVKTGRILLKAAEQGDAEAQFKLGKRSFAGEIQGGKPDFPGAIPWFEKAARLGHTESQLALGMMYLEGLGVEKDFRKAREWFVEARKKEAPLAYYYLGQLAEEDADSKNYGVAADQYGKAAESGCVPAIYKMGMLLLKGRGVEKNEDLALEYLNKAAEEGDAGAQCQLGLMCQEGTVVERNFKKAEAWFKEAGKRRDSEFKAFLNYSMDGYKGADADPRSDVNIHERHLAGHAQAQYYLGLIYRDGMVLGQGQGQAERWLSKAACQGHVQAQYDLGTMYLDGLFISKSYRLAFRYLEMAAKQGHAPSQVSLGSMYEQGLYVPQDYSQATGWYHTAALQGNAEAQFNRGRMYEQGLGLPKDYSLAAKWYRKAARQGHPQARLSLGLLYREGDGVEQDYVAAHMWFSLAAAAGSKDAAGFRDRVAGYMTPGQIAQAEKLAREWKADKKDSP